MRWRLIDKVSVTISALLVSSSATFIFLYLAVPAVNVSVPRVEVVVPLTVPAVVSVTTPVQLDIASIKVSTSVTPVGLTKDGDMAIDDNAERVAWYQFGAKPGEGGSAVIAGHYGWKDGVASVFNDLNTLELGDEVTTTDAEGHVQNFVVKRISMYAPEQDATDVFKSDDGKAHLNLITCQGIWNNAAKTYSERLVVFTDLVE